MAQAPVLSPPPGRSSQEEEPKTFKRLLQRLARNPYVLIALLIHLLLLAIFGGKVLLEGMKPKPTEFVGDVQGDNSPPPPPPAQPTPPEETLPVPTQTVTSPEVISTDSMDKSFVMPDIVLPTTPDLAKPIEKAHPPTDNFAKRATDIKNFTKGWTKDGTGDTGSGKSTHASFVCYVAQADGIDPAIYHEMEGGNILRGPIPNLLRMINAWSSNRITAETVAHPLVLSSNELISKKPPFVYFAGFADFVLTDAEVKNLHAYLMSGGAVWGDNGLAGKGSRFDIAFRREMKRVIPDVDKQFEVLPPDHPVYRGNDSFYQLNQVPPGMNFRAEPVEAIKIDGEIAVVYTLNDYTDMMAMGFAPPVKQAGNVMDVIEHRGPTVPWITDRMYIFSSNNNYFRNYTPESCEESFRLAMNIIVHLLTRFQQKLLFTQ